ncbi:hypothetical protein SEA_EMOTION_60 [Arthrobacter phage Emotion]|uniref:Uncharacterized protein n=1 Tax=Arthrobacter phage Emotion TaxID=3038361 RepID=A0AA49ET96_9CAUD|nr:hypothetical protein SEA_EMOTION_60 [Arthrobacter phage Emotion]
MSPADDASMFAHEDEFGDKLGIRRATRSGVLTDDTAYLWTQDGYGGDSPGVFLPRAKAIAAARALLAASGARARVVEDTGWDEWLGTLYGVPAKPVPLAFRQPEPRTFHGIIDSLGTWRPSLAPLVTLPSTTISIPKEAPVATTPDDYAHTDEDGDVLNIEAYENEAMAFLNAGRGVNVAKDAAPEVALALLDRSGWAEGTPAIGSNEADVNMARFYLKKVVRRLGVTAEEKAAAEALDKEALALYSAAHGRPETLATWSSMTDDATRERWRRAATKAREMREEAK